MKKGIAFLIFIASTAVADDKFPWGGGPIEPYFKVDVNPEGELYKYALSGPCGKYLEIASYSMPISDKNFKNYYFYELSKNGEQKNKWAVPNDSMTMAISGQTLTLKIPSASDTDEFVHVHTTGKITRGLLTKPIEKFNYVDCPINERTKNAYEFCIELYDESTKSNKIVTTGSVCT